MNDFVCLLLMLKVVVIHNLMTRSGILSPFTMVALRQMPCHSWRNLLVQISVPKCLMCDIVNTNDENTDDEFENM
jgi:hypothetical protein